MSRSNSFYRLFRIFTKIRSSRLKALALLAAHLCRRRYIGVYLDPVLACNIRCRMCYFSDAGSRPRAGRPLDSERLALIDRAFFRRALKLQIGCGAEPTVYAGLERIVERAKKAGVPYIELTTNGQLLDCAKLKSLSDAGLDGITLSLHGTTRATYEYLMQGAEFSLLERLIEAVARLQRERPAFSLRVNYTVNNLNFKELGGIFGLFGDARIDVLQIRPIQRLGDTRYSDFSLEGVIAGYGEVMEPLKEECARRGVAAIMPSIGNLQEVDDRRSEADKAVEEIIYCYVSNQTAYKPDFDLDKDTFDSYWKARGLRGRLMKMAMKGAKGDGGKIDRSKKMNYTID